MGKSQTAPILSSISNCLGIFDVRRQTHVHAGPTCFSYSPQDLANQNGFSVTVEDDAEAGSNLLPTLCEKLAHVCQLGTPSPTPQRRKNKKKEKRQRKKPSTAVATIMHTLDQTTRGVPELPPLLVLVVQVALKDNVMAPGSC